MLDVCDWADFDVFGARDTFKGTFVVNEADIRNLDTRVVDSLKPAERVLVDAQARRITLLFIQEQYCLKGEAGTMRFWRKPETYKDLQATSESYYM